MRLRWTLGTALALVACTVDSDDNSTFGLPGSASMTVGSGGATSGGGGPGGGQDADSGSGGSGGGGSSTTTTGGSSSGGGNQQPPTGPWSACQDVAQCDVGMGCLQVGNPPDQGVCTVECLGGPAGCPASPGGTATLVCILVTAQSICALDCSAGQSCPGGMDCIADADDLGPIQICV